MKNLALIVLAVLITACASLATPTSMDQRLGYALGSTTAVRQTCADLRSRQRLTMANAEKCLTQTDAARIAVELARSAMGRGDITTAQGQLAAATAILASLEAMLKESQ
jgi:glutamate-1-semialdehyde aminotransferase